MVFAFNPAIGPDGQAYVSVSVLLGVASFTFGVPADTALDWLKGFNEQFRACQADLKRAASGLIVPNGHVR
jgi:hypothetical protein